MTPNMAGYNDPTPLRGSSPMIWRMLHPNMTAERLGYIPSFLSEHDPRPAAEQIDSNYKHGGGWRPFKGFELRLDDMSLKYPEDPRFYPLASTALRNEVIYYYEHSWVVIIQPDNSWEIARLD